MLHLLKKLKLGPEIAHNAPVSIQIKILLLVIRRLLAPTKLFSELEHHNTEPLLRL